jgi:purine-binding chemotaxis protein CheW
MSAEQGRAANQFLTFLLAGEEYGVDILRVQEIKGWDKVTRLPQAPPFVLGVINLRGAVVPIVDLRRRFALEPVPPGPTTVVIVVKVDGPRGERTVGMVVDAVSEVYNVPADTIRPPPEVTGNLDTAFVKGLASVGEKMVILLDIDMLINTSVEAAQAAA